MAQSSPHSRYNCLITTPVAAQQLGPRENCVVRLLIRGAGVAGLVTACECLKYGAQITILDPRKDRSSSASWFAGGMLAPECEAESAPPIVRTLGATALDWWSAILPDLVQRNGTLVVTPARDHQELHRFSKRTTGHHLFDEFALSACEPDLAGRFTQALYFAEEGHLDARQALLRLEAHLRQHGAQFAQEAETAPNPSDFDFTIDCTGINHSINDPRLRGVRGEMLLLRTSEIHLSRPVRLLHPRIPVYIVPRDQHLFMVGATMIESDGGGPITARSMMELLNAAYSLHPAFGEAEIVESGTGTRPAYADNLPRVEKSGNTLSINGFYRHGFLLAPALAQKAAAQIFTDQLSPECQQFSSGQ